MAKGGVVTFRCGPSPVTIVMRATAEVRNTSSRVVIDGGGKVTLSGAGIRWILYMDTRDKRQVWTTSHCQDQANPKLTAQNITFAHGNSTEEHFDGGGGGAIFARGGQLKVVYSRLVGNRCDRTGPDLGGVAIHALSEYRNRPFFDRSTYQSNSALWPVRWYGHASGRLVRRRWRVGCGCAGCGRGGWSSWWCRRCAG